MELSSDDCILVKEDVDDNLTTDYNCSGVPCFIFYSKGVIVKDGNNKCVDIIGVDIEKIKDVLNVVKKF